jgi:hypothetical protein
MPYARINMAEFKTRDEMIKTLAVLKNDIKSVFPEIGAFTAIETGETSILTISVYDDEAAAERALEQRDNHHKDKELSDIFSHEGIVECMYIDNVKLALWAETKT